MIGRISLRRVGRLMPYTFRNGRSEPQVWRLIFEEGPEPGACAGYAVKAQRGEGYAIVSEDGETIVGHGDTTRTGTALNDALFAFEKRLRDGTL